MKPLHKHWFAVFPPVAPMLNDIIEYQKSQYILINTMLRQIENLFELEIQIDGGIFV